FVFFLGMRNNVAILTLLILGGTACGQQVKQEAPKTVQEEPMVMSPDKAYQLWKEKPQEVVILDVRTPGEYQSSHVKGATNLDYYANFEAEVQKLPKDKIYLLHCASGRRSGEATAIMRKLGYKAYNMGGFAAVRNAGFPTE
ncbi:MAG: rhodanese-like domain-containing protein, partial [Bacteroidota bacterium]|nr:rhodanese-like domain-containing protein [Bacteroidota bacterium]